VRNALVYSTPVFIVSIKSFIVQAPVMFVRISIVFGPALKAGRVFTILC